VPLSILKNRETTKNSNIKEFVFRKTGNFWIDNGIVGFYRVLSELSTQKELEVASIELSTSGLKFSCNPDELTSILDKVKANLVNFYTSETKNYGWYYDGNKFRSYTKTDWMPSSKYFYGHLPPSSDDKLYVRDLDDAFKLKVEDFLKENEEHKFSFYGSGKNEYVPTSVMRYDVPASYNFDNGKTVCDFCGSETKGKSKDFSIKKYNMPFIVNLNNMKTFYSRHSVSFNICSFCSYASLFACLNIFYNISGENGVFFIPYDSDLSSLERFYGVLNISRRSESAFTNYDKLNVVTNYLHENLLLFLYNIYQQSFQEMRREERLDLLNKKIYGFIGNKQGNNVTFFELTEFSRVAELFELFKKLSIAEFGKNEFSSFLRNFWEKDKKETILREKFATRFLELEYLNDVVEEQMYENFESLPYVGRFITTYNMEVDRMDEQMVSMCKSIGNRVGAQCRESQNKGALYSIRNSKNLNEFLKVLSQLQYLVDISFSEKLFLAIDDDNWERYKSLISIFAMNSFSYKPKQENKEDNQ